MGRPYFSLSFQSLERGKIVTPPYSCWIPRLTSAAGVLEFSPYIQPVSFSQFRTDLASVDSEYVNTAIGVLCCVDSTSGEEVREF